MCLDLPTKSKLNRFQVQMIRTGWVRARREGWTQKDWVSDCAALLGVSFSCVAHVVQGNNWRPRVSE